MRNLLENIIRDALIYYMASYLNKTPYQITQFIKEIIDHDAFDRIARQLIYFLTREFVDDFSNSDIKHAIEILEKGENLPHSGRFMLATFLLSRNQSVQQIAPLFKNAPDYNERATLYQLNHLAGI